VLLGRLSARQLAWLMGVLFLVNLFVPDPIPFVDETLMGLLTLWLSSRRGQ
jgi:hypothetical protein